MYIDVVRGSSELQLEIDKQEGIIHTIHMYVCMYMYIHVTCFVVVVLACRVSYICMYEYVQNSKSTQQRILVITSPC